MTVAKCPICGVSAEHNHVCAGEAVKSEGSVPLAARESEGSVSQELSRHAAAALNAAARSKLWRAENRDRYNAYMKEYQRKRRAG